MESIRATYSASTNLPLDEFAERMAVAQTIGLKELDLDQLEFPEETRREVKACIANASWRPTGARQKKGEAPAAEAGPPQVFELDYPIGVFDRTGGLGQLLAVVAGQLTAYVDALRLRLIDLDLPRTILKRFRGPRFGNVGIRRQLGRNADRGPLLGVIMRPNLGLRPAQYADIAFEIAAGGADFIKDDEKFSNPAYCPYEERVPLVLEKLAAAKKVSGRQTLYIVNATARANEIPRTIRKLKKMGAGAILLPGFCVGLALVEGIVRTGFGLPIYCHRAGYATLARSSDFGIDTFVLTKLLRLAGADMFSVGMIGGVNAANQQDVRMHYRAATCEWGKIMSSLPISTAGMHPGTVPHNLRVYGPDIALFGGAGVHGHPEGTRAGVVAMRQAIDAALQGERLVVAQQNKRELRSALGKWGELDAGEDVPRRIE